MEKVKENRLLELALRRRSVRRYTNEHIEDGAIASSYILLAAEQYGLGACSECRTGMRY